MILSSSTSQNIPEQFKLFFYLNYFPILTCEAQNFISKTSSGLYSMTKGISKISFGKRLMALWSTLRSSKFSHIFIHNPFILWCIKLAPKYLQLFMAFKTHEVGETHLFFKTWYFKVHIWNLEKSLGKKVNFFDSLETTEILGIFKLSVYIDIVLLNFSKYSRTIKIIVLPQLFSQIDLQGPKLHI